MDIKGINGFIEHWKKGNDLAFNHVLDYYYPRLLAASLRMVPNREDAEELVMNTLLKIWQNKHRLSGVVKFDSYLFGILRQEISGRARKRILAAENIDALSPEVLGSTDHPEFTLAELQAAYEAALSKLTPKQREIFLLSREHDMSQQTIAEKTGLSVHTVNNHMTSALKLMREELKIYPEPLLVMVLTTPLIGVV